MREHIDLVVLEEQRKAGGFSAAIAGSLLLHMLIAMWFMRAYRPVAPAAAEVPIARYVELMKQNPQQFVEAPGPKADRAPLRAPLSDANRKASMPEPTGERPTTRPGDGNGVYTPPSGAGATERPSRGSAPSPARTAAGPAGATAPSRSESARDSGGLAFREPEEGQTAPSVDWKSAIAQAARPSRNGGAGGFAPPSLGGERGYAEQGPLSFETQWYDWGEYAQSMVSRIRVNWYANMPQIIRTGLQGVVTIRFTIQRDGTITDIEILSSSGVPPYDFAARKAIELSSPLNPLPKDFPNPDERVTVMFYYNREIPR